MTQTFISHPIPRPGAASGDRIKELKPMTNQPGARLTPLALGLLSLLQERPMHPYEMYQLLLKRREDHLLKLRPGSLYHTVTRLAEQGMVRAERKDRAGNRPERTTYRVTQAGTAALHVGLKEIIRRPVREYPAFPVALAESHNLPAEEVAALLEERITRLGNDITELEAVREWVTSHAIPRRYWMVIDYLHSQAVNEVCRLRRLIEEFRDGSLDLECIQRQ
ncbi:PadR family transcriptional regulator [Nocardia aobensis]|uniref:PadR family transcriptional regulator n=1 Tax=Nocardia aobensis TaxID=257277 RepID=A0ABW6PF32_9NOCA